jgi:hypothetical protein
MVHVVLCSTKGVDTVWHLQVFQGDICLKFTLERWDSFFQYTSQEGDSRELHNEELNNLYTSPDIDRIDGMGWDGMGQMCSALNKFSVFQFIISASHQASLA